MSASERRKTYTEGDDCACNGYECHRIRLEWLAWWTRWAVENCKHPVLANS